MRLGYGSAAFARIKHPTEQGRYYNGDTAEWSDTDFTSWEMDNWHYVFGRNGLPPKGAREWTDSQGRLWEFYGFHIPFVEVE
jgi:hypothetical protein